MTETTRQVGKTGRRQVQRTATLVLLLLAATLAFGDSTQQKDRGQTRSRIAPELARRLSHSAEGQDSKQTVEVIVQFRQSPSDVQLQKVGKLGGFGTQKLNLIHGGVFRMPLASIKALADDADVVYISPNRPVNGAADYTEATVGADVAQSYGWDGSGVTVAVIDSGITDHPDLRDPLTGKSRVVYSESFVPGTDTLDHYGHGTHVAGIVAGNAQQSFGLTNSRAIYGVAPKVRLVNLKVLDGNGSGQDSYVIAALQRAIALKSTYNIRVVNLSLGRRVYESYMQDPLCQAVEAAWRAGLVVVVAAGNWGRDNSLGTNGYAMIGVPGNDPYVITVGAMNTMSTSLKSDDVIATYSSKGPTLLDHVAKPDLVAPGNRIASLLDSGSSLDVQFPLNEISPLLYGGSLYSPKAYFKLSGTSMATPVVSGAAVLMLQQDPTLTPDVIKARLMKSADKSFPQYTQAWVNGVLWTYQYDIFTVGAGYLNIPAAMSNQDTVTGTALSPVAVRDASGNVSLQTDGSAIWDSSVIWGSSVVWGNALVSGSSVIWGSSVVWGNNTLDGCSVIWGSSVVWGNSVNATGATDALSIDGGGDNDGQ